MEPAAACACMAHHFTMHTQLFQGYVGHLAAQRSQARHVFLVAVEKEPSVYLGPGPVPKEVTVIDLHSSLASGSSGVLGQLEEELMGRCDQDSPASTSGPQQGGGPQHAVFIDSISLLMLLHPPQKVRALCVHMGEMNGAE
jgi:hypothetical protein